MRQSEEEQELSTSLSVCPAVAPDPATLYTRRAECGWRKEQGWGAGAEVLIPRVGEEIIKSFP